MASRDLSISTCCCPWSTELCLRHEEGIGELSAVRDNLSRLLPRLDEEEKDPSPRALPFCEPVDEWTSCARGKWLKESLLGRRRTAAGLDLGRRVRGELERDGGKLLLVKDLRLINGDSAENEKCSPTPFL